MITYIEQKFFILTNILKDRLDNLNYFLFLSKEMEE